MNMLTSHHLEIIKIHRNEKIYTQWGFIIPYPPASPPIFRKTESLGYLFFKIVEQKFKILERMTRIKELWPKPDNSAFLSLAIPSPFPVPRSHYKNKCHYPHMLRLSHKILSSPVSSIWQFAHATHIIWGLMKA